MAKYDLSKMSSLLGDIQKQPSSREGMAEIDIEKLIPFSVHPFKVTQDERMEKLIQSIEQNGIITPITVRKKGDLYEIISGHRRVYAAQQNDIKQIPAIITEIDDDSAKIIMVDSNLTQREEILPSEKAFAYKIKLEALKNQGKRNDLTSAHSVPKSEARELIANESGENRMTISRYIRLTYLIGPLLDKVDMGALGFIPAVDLSYLGQSQQEIVDELIDLLKIKPTKMQAAQLKKIAQEGELTREEITNILIGKKSKPRTFKYPISKIKKIVPMEMQNDLTEEKLQEIFDEALLLWKAKYN